MTTVLTKVSKTYYFTFNGLRRTVTASNYSGIVRIWFENGDEFTRVFGSKSRTIFMHPERKIIRRKIIRARRRISVLPNCGDSKPHGNENSNVTLSVRVFRFFNVRRCYSLANYFYIIRTHRRSSSSGIVKGSGIYFLFFRPIKLRSDSIAGDLTILVDERLSDAEI